MPDLLPPNATPFERAFAQAAVYPTLEQPIKTLWSPQTCPEAQLPWLAWALSVDEWDAAWPVETKRQAVAASIEQHRKKGTVGALRRALQRLGYEVEIDEQTGVAYTFRLRFKVREGESAGGAVAEDALNRAVVVALRQKNARSSLLENLYVAETDPAGLFIGGVTMSGISYESKGTEEYVTPPYDLSAGQDGASQIAASWTADGEYYEVGVRLASTNAIVTGTLAYSPFVSGLTVFAGEYKLEVRSHKDGRFSSWAVSDTFTVSILPPSSITTDTGEDGALYLEWINLESDVQIQICVAGNGWASIPYTPTELTTSNARYTGMTPGFYDVRVRSIGTAYPGVTAYSEWTDITNIEVL